MTVARAAKAAGAAATAGATAAAAVIAARAATATVARAPKAASRPPREREGGGPRTAKPSAIRNSLRPFLTRDDNCNIVSGTVRSRSVHPAPGNGPDPRRERGSSEPLFRGLSAAAIVRGLGGVRPLSACAASIAQQQRRPRSAAAPRWRRPRCRPAPRARRALFSISAFCRSNRFATGSSSRLQPASSSDGRGGEARRTGPHRHLPAGSFRRSRREGNKKAARDARRARKVGSFCCPVLPVPLVSASVARLGPNRAFVFVTQSVRTLLRSNCERLVIVGTCGFEPLTGYSARAKTTPFNTRRS